jgi:tripartite-type tricarboxylate transporter receptor subunit TctC
MKLNGYARAALQTPEVRDVLKTFGSEAVGSTPDEFGPAFAAEVERYKEVVARLNLPPQD